MKKEMISLVFHLISILCGVWFLATGWIWTFGAAAFISYPVGVIGLFFWGLGNKSDNNRKKPVLTIYIIALAISLVSLLFYR